VSSGILKPGITKKSTSQTKAICKKFTYTRIRNPLIDSLTPYLVVCQMVKMDFYVVNNKHRRIV